MGPGVCHDPGSGARRGAVERSRLGRLQTRDGSDRRSAPVEGHPSPVPHRRSIARRWSGSAPASAVRTPGCTSIANGPRRALRSRAGDRSARRPAPDRAPTSAPSRARSPNAPPGAVDHRRPAPTVTSRRSRYRATPPAREARGPPWTRKDGGPGASLGASPLLGTCGRRSAWRLTACERNPKWWRGTTTHPSQVPVATANENTGRLS